MLNITDDQVKAQMNDLQKYPSRRKSSFLYLEKFLGTVKRFFCFMFLYTNICNSLCPILASEVTKINAGWNTNR